MSQASRLRSRPEDGPNSESFRLLADRLVELGKQIGVRILGYRYPDLPHFRALPPAMQSRVLAELKTYLEICEVTKSAGHKLRDSRQLIWHGLRLLGFLPPDDLFEKLQDQMVIEVHGPELHQIFRNFVFYEYCSYSLEQLHCLPWTELYQRDEGAGEEMMGVVKQIFERQLPFVDCRGIKHFIRETQSVFKLQMNYELIYSWGLKGRGGQTEAWLVAEAAQLIDPPSAQEEERLLRPFLNLSPVDC